MLQHHLKTAFRNLSKRKAYALLNIFGLAIGIAACLLIGLFVLEAFSYDHFHENADRIYRIRTHAVMGENEWNSALVSPALGEVLAAEIPAVEAVVRLDQFDNQILRYEDRVFNENNVLAAEPSLFTIFTFPLLEGDPSSALAKPYSVVITKKIADKYFGTDQNVLGRSLFIDEQAYQVNGLLEKVPGNSHLDFDIVFSFNSLSRARSPQWGNTNTYTYFLLREGGTITDFPQRLATIQEQYSPAYQQIKAAGFSWELPVQALTDIHLYSHLEDELRPNGNMSYVIAFSLIALFILIIACINYMNLATARSADRAREVGIRKTLGSDRYGLVLQFLTESMVICSIAVVLALGLVEAGRASFERIIGQALEISLLNQTSLLLGVGALTILVSLLAGAYPAFYLSRFQAIDVLRGTLEGGSRNSALRNTLVVFQFVISVALIASTLLVYQQLRFIQNKDLGFNRENVLVIRNANKLGTQQNAFIESVKRDPKIQAVSFSEQSPFDEYQGSSFTAKGDSENEARLLNFLRISDSYLPTLGIGLKAGRNFSEEIAADSAAIVLNEAAVQSLGLDDPINSIVYWGAQAMQVIGVTENFHFRSLHDEIQPLAFIPTQKGKVLELRIAGGNPETSISFLEDQWQKHSGGNSPLEYSFLDSDFEALFKAEQQMGRLFAIFALFTIFIACLGLVALAAFMAERRTKEIGIRKVMGANTENIVVLLTKDFTKLVLIAIIIASPLAYYAIQQWLNDFAYHITIHWTSFALAGLTALLIAWLTVGYQSVKAALTNPIDALRDD